MAWVANDQGVRNVWASGAELATGSYRSHPVTSYVGDDGFDLGEVSWDPAGRVVVYTRGGSLEGGGPVNALSLPAGAPLQKIWAVNVGGGAPREIGAGHTPLVSPKGTVAFLSGGQIWTAPPCRRIGDTTDPRSRS